MTTSGKNLSPTRVAARRRQAVWLTRRGWKLGEIARELRVSVRTVERYRAYGSATRAADVRAASPLAHAGTRR